MKNVSGYNPKGSSRLKGHPEDESLKYNPEHRSQGVIPSGLSPRHTHTETVTDTHRHIQHRQTHTTTDTHTDTLILSHTHTHTLGTGIAIH